MFARIRGWLETEKKGEKRPRSHLLWFVPLLLVGFALVFVSSLFEPKPTSISPSSSSTVRAGPPDSHVTATVGTIEQVERDYEQKIADMLRHVVGLDVVKVYVNLDSLDEVVVEKNRQDTQQVTTEKDRQGGERQVTELVRDGQVAMIDGASAGSKQPLVLKRIKPRIRGVLIVARGAEQPVLMRMISEAVRRSLEVPAHRISVMPAKSS